MTEKRKIELDDDAQLIVRCRVHGIEKKPWIVCVHVADDVTPKVARRIEDEQISGEVLCADCCNELNAAEGTDNTGPTEHLRFACESCVLELYKLTTSN